MITWQMTARRDLERSRPWPIYISASISRNPLEIESQYRWRTYRIWPLANRTVTWQCYRIASICITINFIIIFIIFKITYNKRTYITHRVLCFCSRSCTSTVVVVVNLSGTSSSSIWQVVRCPFRRRHCSTVHTTSSSSTRMTVKWWCYSLYCPLCHYEMYDTGSAGCGWKRTRHL